MSDWNEVKDRERERLRNELLCGYLTQLSDNLKISKMK